MIPVIAIVGRPNVGKSTLFNCLTQSRDAVVADIPGVTRDRQYGTCHIGDKPFVIIDTGGISSDHHGIQGLTVKQAEQAILEADLVLFIVDARRGVMPADSVIAQQLRKINKSIVLVANKIDGLDPAVALADFHSLGFGNPLAVAAAHQRGIEELARHMLRHVPPSTSANEESALDEGIKIAIAGRPNVGKSTLVNRMLGEERVIVYDAPGTTRDSIYIPLERAGKKYILVDTAGVRKRGQITETIEKISVVKTLQAIENANVIIYLIDARTGITDQDLSLLGFVLELGRAIVVAINKWDGLTSSQRDEVKRGLDRRLSFLEFAKLRFISALHGTGVGDLFNDVHIAYQSATRKLSTSLLNRILEKAVTAHQPPLMHGRRIKLRYAHAGGQNPPLIIIHGNQVNSLPESYQRYLSSTYRKALKLIGTPVRIQLKEGENPFKNKHNPLSDRQLRKRKRIIKHRKKAERY